jgi:hypothetical protein
MTDHKFTDDDVVETLKNAKYKVDGAVTRGYYLSPETFNAVVDLIGRQKAELEDLREIVFMDRSEAIKNLIAEAIKDFAERLIDKCTDPHWCVWMNEIEDLVTEMTENKR